MQDKAQSCKTMAMSWKALKARSDVTLENQGYANRAVTTTIKLVSGLLPSAQLYIILHIILHFWYHHNSLSKTSLTYYDLKNHDEHVSKYLLVYTCSSYRAILPFSSVMLSISS